MSQTLGALIADAQEAYAAAAVTYQGASIDQKVKSKPALDKAATQLAALQLKQLDEAKEVDAQDEAAMTLLREQVNNAATLQTGLMTLVSVLTKFI
ncbi:hypothetical protein HED22_08305 [Thalassospira sp. HF15]|uniref:hypothetical protein n=1 Tax=Thalassospira sp. HF15 TaxID=2722755 RepID=UPI0014314515|nr:hypothetical protein [Thalassospira sp. HF15]NIY75642.1 hypothetical protein [Thalassospira sp. HF15]